MVEMSRCFDSEDRESQGATPTTTKEKEKEGKEKDKDKEKNEKYKEKEDKDEGELENFQFEPFSSFSYKFDTKNSKIQVVDLKVKLIFFPGLL